MRSVTQKLLKKTCGQWAKPRDNRIPPAYCVCTHCQMRAFFLELIIIILLLVKWKLLLSRVADNSAANFDSDFVALPQCLGKLRLSYAHML